MESHQRLSHGDKCSSCRLPLPCSTIHPLSLALGLHCCSRRRQSLQLATKAEIEPATVQSNSWRAYQVSRENVELAANETNTELRSQSLRPGRQMNLSDIPFLFNECLISHARDSQLDSGSRVMKLRHSKGAGHSEADAGVFTPFITAGALRLVLLNFLFSPQFPQTCTSTLEPF